MNYKDLNIKIKQEYETITFNEQEIKVLKKIDTNSLYDLVMITLQKSREDNIYNPIKIAMYFYVNIVYMYTDIIFSAEDRADEAQLYDELEQSGLLDMILNCIDDEQFNGIYAIIEELIEKLEKQNTSVVSMFHDFIKNMPINAAEAMKIVDNFDKSKYQEVVDFAKAANGGRPIA